MENKKTTKLKFAATEKIALLPVRKTPLGHRYAVTNHGRVISYTTNPKEGIFLKQGKIGKYCGTCVARTTYLVHRLIAKGFLNKPKSNQTNVIHLDYDNQNNHYKNLKWVSREEQEDHIRKNPLAKNRGNQKLTLERVKLIKEKLTDGKTSLKALAKKYKVSDMQIHRIKTGENWGHVKI